MRYLLPFGLVLAACAPVPDPLPDPDLPLLRGYRADADQCQLVGESDVTAEFLDHTADLVACPADYEGLGVFVTETGAVQVSTYGDYILYSVSRG